MTKERSKWDSIFQVRSNSLNFLLEEYFHSSVSGSTQGQDHRKYSKEGDGQIAPSKPSPCQDLEAGRCGSGCTVSSLPSSTPPQDGQLDADEFALSMHLINIKLDGFDLPDDLPHHLVPPSKKKVYNGNGAGSASGSDESY